MSTHPIRRLIGPCLMPFVLAACSVLGGGNEAPAQKEPARLNIAISADADLNTDIKGRGAPVLLRIYELKSDVSFQEAAFFALQNTDKAVLGADLLAVDQFILRPGETRQIVRKSNPETTAIGVFAGYRDLPNATWRLVHRLPPAVEQSWYRMVMPANKVRLKVDLHANALQITDELAGKPAMQHAEESKNGLDPGPADEVRPSARGGGPTVGEMVNALPKPPVK
ncbi:type VI secretion system lipoprotein TssJ [Rhodoferax koreensis]|nr:type VI secretion system lipoprotein TssJ [Rhodoferax koreense]